MLDAGVLVADRHRDRAAGGHGQAAGVPGVVLGDELQRPARVAVHVLGRLARLVHPGDVVGLGHHLEHKGHLCVV
ncbi:MAG: chaplin family protein [Actinomycetes bacterium]